MKTNTDNYLINQKLKKNSLLLEIPMNFKSYPVLLLIVQRKRKPYEKYSSFISYKLIFQDASIVQRQ